MHIYYDKTSKITDISLVGKKTTDTGTAPSASEPTTDTGTAPSAPAPATDTGTTPSNPTSPTTGSSDMVEEGGNNG